MPPCAKCGHDNPEGARFCSQCGAALSAPPAERALDSTTTTQSLSHAETEQERSELTAVDQAAVDALPAGSALLVVQKGPNSGSRFLLDSDITTAGRHPDSDIFLDDVTVSRRHAELHRRGDGFLVRDVGSLNGTYVNRERIETATLSGGDEVQIGKYRLVYHASEQAAGEA
ncbi:MAG: FHA domain-containing protein [Acidothermales bacterium]|jgi:pSer/pThr/pTyr-binding forkhead associated (FHA) protein|nr:FHA domain-containing protein [Acidothermales bacterium]